MFANACNRNLKFNFTCNAEKILTCKGICLRYDKVGGGKNSAYAQGYKRCTGCSLYIKYNGIRCPCCNFPLRTKKRN
ncbi:MAG: hypothetical protein DA329_08000 [Candidatus Nitrosocosmicus sp.]|nr:hypothetical protein [Candidatus Nitrosocosmicus sp.]